MTDEPRVSILDSMTEDEKHILMMELEEMAQRLGYRNFAKSGTETSIDGATQSLIDSKADINDTQALLDLKADLESPTLITPVLGVATATLIEVAGTITSKVNSGTAGMFYGVFKDLPTLAHNLFVLYGGGTVGDVDISGGGMIVRASENWVENTNSGTEINFIVTKNGTYNTRVTGMKITSECCVGINTSSPNANAILDAVSTTKAFMPPRMTSVQKSAIPSPTAGMVVYDTTLNKLCVYTTAWETITSV